MLSQRRRHSRWRMSHIILLLLGLICSGELVPVKVTESSSSATLLMPNPTRKSLEINSLGEFGWHAWLLLDAPGMDSATILRRIKPKSVFIAPKLPECAEGYHADAMGRCVKDVNIDERKQMDFFLKRLNSMYANQSNNNEGEKKSTGPLQLNIPLIDDSTSHMTKIDHAEQQETFSNNNPSIPAHNKTRPDDEEKTRPHEAVVTVYEVKNDTTLNEDERMFFLGNTNSDNVGKHDQKFDAVVPVAELAEETKDTKFSEVMDYKIPIDLKTLLNITSVTKVNISDVVREGISGSGKRENTTEMSPTLVLLISPTKPPSVNDLSLTQNVTIGPVIVQMSNVTTREIINVTVPGATLLPTEKLTEIPLIAVGEHRNNETDTEDELAPEISKLNESQETEFLYDEEDEDMDYAYSTDLPDEEESMEGEEILKHGEAGMTIPERNTERLHHDRQQQNQTDQKKTLDIHHQIMIRFNDSTPTRDTDEMGSNVSSEVSINDDLILETTLLDVNTERLQSITKPPEVSRKIVKNNKNDSKELFGENAGSEPEVVFSQDAYGTISSSLHGRKQIKHTTRVENERNEKLEATRSSSESLLYDPSEENPITEYHTIDEEQRDVKESAPQENSKDTELDVPVSSFGHTLMNLGSINDYVRFPDFFRQPQQNGYVRFPSNEANNIIHSPSYKQHYATDDIGPYGGTSTKSSIPVRQKSDYYLTGPTRKLDRSQTDHVPAALSESQKQRQAAYLSFWSKMPFIIDPSMYSVDNFPNNEATGNRERKRLNRTTSSRRARFHAETSTEDVDRLKK